MLKILLSSLPASPWWGKGMPVYQNNWAMQEGNIPDNTLAQNEHRELITLIQKKTQTILRPFPEQLDTKKYKHDAVFVRDSFVSNQKGSVVMSHFRAKQRQDEADSLKITLQQMGFTTHTVSQNSYTEGGEFYYVPSGDILFAGTSRNNKEGVLETAKLLGIKNLCIVQSDAYHLDTVFTIILDNNGALAGIILCPKMITNIQAIKTFARKFAVPLFAINPDDSIDFSGQGTIAVNCLPLPGKLIGGGKFQTPGIEEQIKKLKITHYIRPVSQFHLSGGGVHCLTNELLYTK